VYEQQGASHLHLFPGELSAWRRAHTLSWTVSFLERVLAIRTER
jgi:hypothetical protein